MPTQSLAITAGADDGYSQVSNFDSSDLEINIGRASNPVGSWLRFLNVSIPQGATVVSAVLTVEAVTVGLTVSDVRTKINADAVDNAVAPTSHAEFVALTRTTAQVDFDPVVWKTGAVYDLPDLSAVVQEVIDRAGWVAGNALQLLWDNDGTAVAATRIVAASYESATRQEPRLVVTYSVGDEGEVTAGTLRDGLLG